jgi:hypothetical protein
VVWRINDFAREKGPNTGQRRGRVAPPQWRFQQLKASLLGGLGVGGQLVFVSAFFRWGVALIPAREGQIGTGGNPAIAAYNSNKQRHVINVFHSFSFEAVILRVLMASLWPPPAPATFPLRCVTY